MSPILTLFVNLIPFLLMTAVFIHTAVIDLYLPIGSLKTKDQKAEEEQKSKKEQLLILSIAPQGFYLILEDKLVKIIPKVNDYDFDKLEEILQKIKKHFPMQESIIIESDDNIIYDHIIHTMDRCRDSGLVNTSLSASKS